MSREAGLNKAPDAFRTISEVAEELDLPQHVLRFWESRFPHVKPLKRGGGRRYYRPEDIDLLRGIRRLLYSDGYTIKGVQRILREQGVRTVQSVGQGQEVLNAAVLSQDDAPGAGDGSNGKGALVPGDVPARPEVPPGEGENASGLENAAPAWPQNGPIAQASVASTHALTVTPVRRLEAAHVGLADAVAAPAAATPVAVKPIAVAMPSPHSMPARDLERLKQALGELETCRRLLEKAIEEGR